MTGLYEYWSLPHKLNIKCPSCQSKANFEFARFAKKQNKKDIDYFQQHRFDQTWLTLNICEMSKDYKKSNKHQNYYDKQRNSK